MVISNLLNFVIAISSVLLFPRVLLWITSCNIHIWVLILYEYIWNTYIWVLYICIYMSIFTDWIAKMDLLQHRTCLFENCIYFQLECPPQGLCQWQILPTCGSAHFPIAWLGRDTLNGFRFCQGDQQEIAFHSNLHIPVMKEVTAHIFSYFICLLGICISSVHYLSMFFIHFSIGLFII